MASSSSSQDLQSKEYKSQHIMPPQSPDKTPNHALGPLITIRLLTKDDHSPAYTDMTWNVEWIRMRMNETFGSKFSDAGECYWWVQKRVWLDCNDTPALVGVKHMDSVRVVFADEPEEGLDIPDVQEAKVVQANVNDRNGRGPWGWYMSDSSS